MKWAERLPEPLRTLFRHWMAFGKLMSKIVNGILLTIVFVTVFPLVAIGLRVGGKDLLGLRLPPGSKGWGARRRLGEDLESARHLF